MLLGRVFGICNLVEGHVVVLIQFEERMPLLFKGSGEKGMENEERKEK